MNIYMRDKNNNLVIKDILTINFDMSVFYNAKNGKYYVQVNNNYLLEGEFDSKAEAESAMIEEALKRDALEAELRNDV